MRKGRRTDCHINWQTYTYMSNLIVALQNVSKAPKHNLKNSNLHSWCSKKESQEKPSAALPQQQPSCCRFSAYKSQTTHAYGRKYSVNEKLIGTEDEMFFPLFSYLSIHPNPLKMYSSDVAMLSFCVCVCVARSCAWLCQVSVYVHAASFLSVCRPVSPFERHDRTSWILIRTYVIGGHSVPWRR
jgi:hypothetical protein